MKHYDMSLKEAVSHGDMEFPVDFYQFSIDNPGQLIYHHWHTECEILYVIHGVANLYIDNIEYIIEEGNFAFISPGKVHGAYNKSNNLCELYIIVFDVDMLTNNFDVSKSIFQEIKNEKLIPYVTYTHFSSLETKIREYFLKAVKLYKNKSEFYELGIKTQLLNILYEIVSNDAYNNLTITTSYKSVLNVHRIKILIEYIENNYKEQIKIRQMAELLNLSTEHFCRFFKEMIGMSAIDYINNYRIKSASEMMLKTDMSLLEISLECGFNNLSYFIKQFKRINRVTPAQYRKENNKNY